MTGKEAIANATRAIVKAESSAAFTEVAQVHLQTADRWLALAVTLANEPGLVEQAAVGVGA